MLGDYFTKVKCNVLSLVAASPRSLVNLCRVRVRQAIGPVFLNESDLSYLDLDESLLNYVMNIRHVCEAGSEVKRLSLMEAVAEYRREMLLKEKEHQLVPLRDKNSPYSAVMV